MRKILIITFATAIGATTVFAQKSVNFEVTVAEAQTILNAIGERPWKDVNTLMEKLIGQANAQLKPAAPLPAPAERSQDYPEQRP